MRKPRVFGKKRVERLLNLAKIAKKELGNSFSEYHDERLRFLQKQNEESLQFSREADINLSKRNAEFMFNHSEEINAAIVSAPKFLTRFIDLNVNDWFNDPGIGDPMGIHSWDEFIQTAKILGELRSKAERGVIIVPNMIYFTSFPKTLKFGEYFTILGGNFGAHTGRLYIEIIETGRQEDLIPWMWSDTAIHGSVPTNIGADLGGLPFEARAKLYVQNGTTDSKAFREVTLLASFTLRECNDHYSDSGWVYSSQTYTKTVTLTSKVLPRIYRLSERSDLTPPGLKLSTSDWTTTNLGDDPCSVTLIAGPYEQSHRLNVDIIITDDYYWDYTVTASFLIDVPQGYSHPDWY